jgi:NAD+ synthase (glutamine-hydrolysing)
LAENKKFARGSQLTVCDADVELLIKERVKRGHNPQKPAAAARKIEFNISGEKSDLLRIVPPLPFVSARKTKLDQNCEDTMNIQCAGLAKRLLHTGSKTAVIGISGGLDSTLALLITARTFDMLEKPRKDIIAVTMPGFGTSGRTFENSRALMKEFKVTAREIPISKSVALHLEDIGHSPEARDATYENAQARERTQILMDLANKERGIVIGTGDLSEIALGWSTYNGDHMSMYSVNCGVPKTFIRSLIDWIVNFTDYGENAKRLLNDVLNTPVSPELLPPDEKGDIGQKTEEIVGPYELTDFFLYYAQRYGFSPAKIVFLARNAFGEKYSRKTIVKFLKEFYKRFFASQFKRSCMPDGPKVGRVALSPRADWRAPSDASGAVWLKELDFLCRLD